MQTPSICTNNPIIERREFRLQPQGWRVNYVVVFMESATGYVKSREGKKQIAEDMFLRTFTVK